MDRPFKLVELQQNSSEWHAWRHKGTGASGASVAISKRGMSRARLLEEKRGSEPPEDSYTNEAMDTGTKLEPKARSRYNEKYGTNVRAVCVQSTQYPWLRASLDGLSEDGNLVLEIKCGARVHQQALERFPVQYKAQVQHILAVTGLPSINFWCYWPESPNRKYWRPLCICRTVLSRSVASSMSANCRQKFVAGQDTNSENAWLLEQLRHGLAGGPATLRVSRAAALKRRRGQ